METILDTVTDTDQVRSVIGVSDRDLSDEEFDTPRVQLELTIAMDESSIDYTTVVTDGEGATPTVNEVKRYNYLKLHSLYFCAALVFPRLRLLATQKMSDGDNAMERFLDPEFSDMESKFSAKAQAYKNSLAAAISDTTVTTTIDSPLSGVAPSYDPVTGS